MIIWHANQSIMDTWLGDFVVKEEEINKRKYLPIFTLRSESAGFNTGMNAAFLANLQHRHGKIKLAHQLSTGQGDATTMHLGKPTFTPR